MRRERGRDGIRGIKDREEGTVQGMRRGCIDGRGGRVE